MMKKNNIDSSRGSAESTFGDYMQRGDDFFKIELLRQAKSCYKCALALDIKTEIVKSRISECDRLLAFENKVVYILIAIFSALMLVYLIAFY